MSYFKNLQNDDNAAALSYSPSVSVATERAAFIRLTYAHLAGAVLALIGLEALLLNLISFEQTVAVLGQSPWMFLGIFIGFIVISNLAHSWAASQTSRGVQYFGLSLYILAEAVMLFPLLSYSQYLAQTNVRFENIVPTAGILTLAVFAALSTVVFVTKKDFSFLGSLLTLLSFAALGFILVAVIFGISLGAFFCAAMIVLMGGYILYETSNVLHHYPTDMHVAAALVLFASVATMFWYILRLLLILSSGRE